MPFQYDKATGLPLISPSQINDHEPELGGCPRRWGFKKIDKLPDPAGLGALLGTLVHRGCEQHFRGERIRIEGRYDDKLLARAERIARVMVKSPLYDCEPGHLDLLVEHEVRFERWCAGCNGTGWIDDSDGGEGCSACRGAGGWMFRGYSDLIWEHDERTLVVADHKTSSNPSEYGLDQESLPYDVQAMGYAGWGVSLGYEAIDLRWNYVPTREAPCNIPVRAVVSAGHVRRALPILDEYALRIVESGKAKQAIDLPANPGTACGDFGGCPFADRCPLTQEERMSVAFDDF